MYQLSALPLCCGEAIAGISLVGQKLRCRQGCETCEKNSDFGPAALAQRFLFGKSLPTRIFAGLFITIGKKKMDEGEQLWLLSFPFNSLILEEQSGRGPRAGRPFVFYVLGC